MLFCELDGRAGGHAVWGVGGLVDAVLRAWRPGARGHAVWGAGGCCFASLTTGCSGACSLGCWWMLFCELDGRVLGGMQFGVLADAVLRA